MWIADIVYADDGAPFFLIAMPTAVELCATVLFLISYFKGYSANSAVSELDCGTFDFSSSMYFTIHWANSSWRADIAFCLRSSSWS